MSYRDIGYVRASMPDDLPRLANYNEARLWYSAVKPFAKGRKVGEKPLGRNRRYDRAIISREAESGAIVITHYNTPILKFYENGAMDLQTGGYDSISTVQILQEVLGPKNFLRRRTKAYYVDTTTGSQRFYRFSNTLSLNADRSVNLATTTTEYYHLLNKQKYKEVQKRYADFMEYAISVNSLTKGGKATTREVILRETKISAHYYLRSAQHVLSSDSRSIEWNKSAQLDIRELFFNKLVEANGDIEKWYPLVLHLSFSCATNMSSTYGDDMLDRTHEWETDTKRMKNFFNTILKYHHASEVFEKVEVPLGEIKHDSNKKFLMGWTV